MLEFARLLDVTDLYDQAASLPRDLIETARNRATLTTDNLHALGRSDQAIWRAVGRGRLNRAFRGVYLPGPADVTFLDQLCAVRKVVPPNALFAFHTAAALHGFGVIRSDKIHITVPVGSRVPQLRGVAAHQHVLPIIQVTEVLGLPCVPAVRCAVDLARSVHRTDAISVLDAALRLGKRDEWDFELLDEAALRAELALHEGRRGVRQVRELLGLADGRAECRQESHLRLAIHDGRLPAPVPQFGVLDEDGWVRYRIDLAYEEERVGIEYDGSSHVDHRRLRLDRRRHNWLSNHGWVLRYFTDDDLYRRSDLIVPTVRQALRLRRSRTS